VLRGNTLNDIKIPPSNNFKRSLPLLINKHEKERKRRDENNEILIRGAICIGGIVEAAYEGITDIGPTNVYSLSRDETRMGHAQHGSRGYTDYIAGNMNIRVGARVKVTVNKAPCPIKAVIQGEETDILAHMIKHYTVFY